MNKIVIGLTGESGGGKETFVNLIRGLYPNLKIAHIKSSDFLKETLDLWDLPASRANLQNMAIIMDNQFGKGSVSRAIYKKILDNNSTIIIFDGVRWETDVEVVRRFPKNYLVYITADAQIRYDRLKKRNEKVGETTTTYLQFLTEEKAKTEIFINQLSTQADIKINNNGTLDELKSQIQEHIKLT